jgi:hypothetical protein
MRIETRPRSSALTHPLRPVVPADDDPLFFTDQEIFHSANCCGQQIRS